MKRPRAAVMQSAGHDGRRLRSEHVVPEPYPGRGRLELLGGPPALGAHDEQSMARHVESLTTQSGNRRPWSTGDARQSRSPAPRSAGGPAGTAWPPPGRPSSAARGGGPRAQRPTAPPTAARRTARSRRSPARSASAPRARGDHPSPGRRPRRARVRRAPRGSPARSAPAPRRSGRSARSPAPSATVMTAPGRSRRTRSKWWRSSAPSAGAVRSVTNACAWPASCRLT